MINSISNSSTYMYSSNNQQTFNVSNKSDVEGNKASDKISKEDMSVNKADKASEKAAKEAEKAAKEAAKAAKEAEKSQKESGNESVSSVLDMMMSSSLVTARLNELGLFGDEEGTAQL